MTYNTQSISWSDVITMMNVAGVTCDWNYKEL